ncbi:thioredoxin-like protein CITRX, chloroplastic isoform X1 [Dendrobium catenatum]|uniref:thioredoxin-like protein CITRX, chloroplastic isoform X1 n=2 Tax=Dendrobium catenatum TaxID=906689 RepID=UPI00109F6288|nr:thioredoxin-like protein CITRX, chloroplastic isoform X1 [Dendrobium catenatum]
MAAGIPGSPPLPFVAYADGGRLSSPATPFLLTLRRTNNSSTIPLPFFRSVSTRNRRTSLAAAAAKKNYIEEDYLVQKKVTAKELEEIVRGERSIPIVLDFYATWCGPCILMAQDLEMLAVEYEENVLFVKVDTDDEYELAQDMQVRGLPTLYFISPDPTKNAIRTEGLIPREMIKNIIDNEMTGGLSKASATSVYQDESFC